MKFPFMCIVVIFASTIQAAAVNVYDGFESPSLSKLWRSDRFAPGAVQLQRTIVRAGKSAVQITLRPGDVAESGGLKGPPNERAELLEPPELWSVDDRTYQYSFSIWIPNDFSIVPTRLVIAQWKQLCAKDPCDPDNPVIAVRYSDGELRVTGQTGPKSITLYRNRQDVRGKWLDFRFVVNFSRSRDGLIQAWLNNQQVVDYQGVTAYPESGGYPSRNRFYFKIGLYRDRMAQPMTIYVDEYRKAELK